ncbi:MAG: hypothetical protein K5668_09495 [Lachnospiraceae bacterium]|nr:hypothetical protein [Lachnospiraceae bacterium]
MSEEIKNAGDLNDREAKEILKELLEFEKKEARYQKVTSLLIFCLVVIMGIVSFMIVPVAVETLKTANATIVIAQDALAKIDEEMDNINTMTSSITATSNNMNNMVIENSEELSKAVESMSNIDFEGLNKAIKDLEDAVGPFAKVTRLFN